MYGLFSLEKGWKATPTLFLKIGIMGESNFRNVSVSFVSGN